MSLRARLVSALLALFTLGMAVYGVATYRAFASSELTRMDEQLRSTLPVVERELFVGLRSSQGLPLLDRGGRGGQGAPVVVVAPGTYGELRDINGRFVRSIQVAEYPVQPDLSGIAGPDGETMWTVPSLEGEVSWRVAADVRPDGLAVLAAVPMSSVEEALARLLVIEVVAGSVLLVVLGAGAWLVLRSGLRPLERIAVATRTITAGSLEQRVPTPVADTEVRELAVALNTMLDDLEDAFREREATEVRLRRFLSDASHELRTPLTSIQGYAELFRLDAHGEHVDLALVMRRIEDESGRMRELVDDLLSLARVEEAGSLVYEPVDLAVLAADACSDAAASDPDRPIELDAPAPAGVRGDPGHLRQAIGNLVTNAVRHTPAGTPVTVSVRTDGGHVTVRVRDRGRGLDPDTRDRVFDRFWQADPARTGAGSGLGLSIVQAIATEHRGTVSADNARDGGAVFTLVLPADPDRPAAGSDAAVPMEAPDAP